MTQCDYCKREQSTDWETYCVPVQTPVGNLCHKCRAQNVEDMQMFGAPMRVSEAIQQQRAAENAADLARLFALKRWAID